MLNHENGIIKQDLGLFLIGRNFETAKAQAEKARVGIRLKNKSLIFVFEKYCK